MAGAMDFHLSTYYPILIYLAIILVFALSALVVSHHLGPQKKTSVKQMPYESGMDPIGDARQHFDVKFYLIAILFLVFDVELLFLAQRADLRMLEVPVRWDHREGSKVHIVRDSLRMFTEVVNLRRRVARETTPNAVAGVSR